MTGTSQDVFAFAIGISRSHVSNLETGAARPSEQLIKSICREWNVREEWLRTGEEPISSEPPLSPDQIKEVEDILVLSPYKSFGARLESFIKMLKSLKRVLAFRHRGKDKSYIQLLNSQKIEPETIKLQKEILTLLDEIKLLVSERNELEVSTARIIRELDDDSMKDICLLLASKGNRLEDKRREKIKKDIEVLKKAAK